MDFKTAVITGFQNYVNFEGRASRSAFWFFQLFCLVPSILASVFSEIIGITDLVLGGVVNLVLFLPSLSVHVRRLHDINRSGWWTLLAFIPIIGWGILIYFACQKGDESSNRFGEPSV